ncbi:MAG: ATP-dependent helicase [Candidatus Woesearchaeota archaeon]|jgi:DNA helicase-2/ATP-dependent DNA helicase PcrA
MSNAEELKKIIIKSHENDLAQQKVIFSDTKRLLVEAPAGYGKTHTMISKIAYSIACGEITGFKKILALTFSVNAAHKIRKDVNEKLPPLLKNTSRKSSKIVYATNYHGLCFNILKKYGYLLHENLRRIEELEKLEINYKNIHNYLSIAPYQALQQTVMIFDSEVKSYYNETQENKAKRERFNSLLSNYNHIIITKFLPNEKITYNAIISLTIELLYKYPNIKNFYSKYFPFIIVDEYQDTNILNLKLLNSLITDSSKLLFLGDSMQRIYGFIGAVPNLLLKSIRHYNMELIELEKNYRFEDNTILLDIDSFLRKKYKDLSYTQKINDINNIILNGSCPNEEAEKITELLSSLGKNDKTAILFKQRGNNTNAIINYLDSLNIDYFYALFSEEDRDYLKFHEKALSIYIGIKENKAYNSYSKKRSYICKKLKEYYQDELQNNIVISSLYRLLKIFFQQTQSHPNLDERYEIILEVLKNNSLKYYLNSVKDTLILSTIHGAKGLEWDNVILADVEAKTYCWSLCSKCHNKDKSNCFIDSNQINDPEFKKHLLEELSTFYVGITRAKKNLYISYSDLSYQWDNLIPSGASCLLKMLC